MIKHIDIFRIDGISSEEWDFPYTIYSSSLRGEGEFQSLAYDYLKEVCKNDKGEEKVYLFSYDKTRVEVISCMLDFTPNYSIIKGFIESKPRRCEKFYEFEYRIKGYYKFIAMTVQVEKYVSNKTEKYIEVEVDYSSDRLENYKLHFESINAERVILCDNVRVELKRYQFYKILSCVISKLEDQLKGSWKIKIDELLFHQIDSNVNSIYSTVIDILSRVFLMKPNEIDIICKGLFSIYFDVRKDLRSFQVLSRKETDNSILKQFILLERMNVYDEMSFSREFFIREVGIINKLDALFENCLSFTSADDNFIADRAILFYDGYKRKVFGLNYDSNSGSLIDMNGTKVGLNQRKKQIIDEIVKMGKNAGNNG